MMLSHFFPLPPVRIIIFAYTLVPQTLMAIGITMDCMLKVQIPGAQAQKFHLAMKSPGIFILTCNQEVFKELVH